MERAEGIKTVRFQVEGRPEQARSFCLSPDNRVMVASVCNAFDAVQFSYDVPGYGYVVMDARVEDGLSMFSFAPFGTCIIRVVRRAGSFLLDGC